MHVRNHSLQFLFGDVEKVVRWSVSSVHGNGDARRVDGDDGDGKKVVVHVFLKGFLKVFFN